MNGAVFVLADPPGAGKTTVGRLLAQQAGRSTVCLPLDGMFRAIGTGFVLPFLPAASQQNEVVVAATVAAVAEFARGGYDVVVEGVIGPWFLPPFRDLTGSAAASVSYVVLRPDLATTLARATARDHRELRDPDPITGLYEAFTRLGELEQHVVDSGGLDAAHTAEMLRDALAAGRFRLSS